MNIREFAQGKGITPAAVYKRVKAAGIDINTLRDGQRGSEITPEGLEVLRDLFKADKGPELTTEAPELTTEKEELKTVVNELKTENNRLTTELSEAKAQITRLETELNQIQVRETSLTAEVDFLRQALTQSQQLQLATLTKIPSPPALPAAGEARPWYKRIFGRRKGGAEQ